MKINSLYIASFGGVKNLKLDFTDSFNIIYGNNEDGKTTVMAFIKMMFYGSERGGNTLSKNIRKKYTPWDSSAMAGSVDFEHGGKKYRLEKEFRTSNSTDKATLYDLQLSEKVSASGDIGTKFFGLSLQAFERSVFIGQFGFPDSDSDVEGEISSRLSNLALTGDENISFEAVNSRLQKAKLALMSKSGRAGEYDKNIKAASDLEEQIRTLTLAKEEFARKNEAAELLKDEIEVLQKKAEDLKAKISAEQDIRNAEKLKKLLSIKEELDALNRTLTLSDGTVIDEMYLRKLKFCVSKVEAASSKVASKQNEIELLNKSISAGLNPPENATSENAESLTKQIAELNALLDSKTAECEDLGLQLAIIENEIENSKGKRKKANKPLLLSGATVIVFGIILAFVNMTVGVVGLLAGLVLLVLGLAVKPLDTSLAEKLKLRAQDINAQISNAETEQNAISVKLGGVSAKLEAINAALNATAAVIENQQKMLQNAENELVALNAALSEETETLLKLSALYKDTQSVTEVTAFMEEISEKVEVQNKIKTELAVYLKELDGISYKAAREKLSKIPESDTVFTENFEQIKQDFSETLSLIADKKSQYAALIAEAKAHRNAGESLESLKKKRDELKIKLKSQKEFCDILDLASVTLAESFSEVYSSYGVVLEQKAAEIFENLTLGKYKDMYISKSFDIDVGEKNAFGRRDIEFLSSGANDQGYLSLRLALSTLMSKDGEALPVLLDDSLAQYDDARTDAALALLKQYSEKQQVIMFTCHKHICEKSKALEISVKNLKDVV